MSLNGCTTNSIKTSGTKELDCVYGPPLRKHCAPCGGASTYKVGDCFSICENGVSYKVTVNEDTNANPADYTRNPDNSPFLIENYCEHNYRLWDNIETINSTLTDGLYTNCNGGRLPQNSSVVACSELSDLVQAMLGNGLSWSNGQIQTALGAGLAFDDAGNNIACRGDLQSLPILLDEVYINEPGVHFWDQDIEITTGQLGISSNCQPSSVRLHVELRAALTLDAGADPIPYENLSSRAFITHPNGSLIQAGLARTAGSNLASDSEHQASEIDTTEFTLPVVDGKITVNIGMVSSTVVRAGQPVTSEIWTDHPANGVTLSWLKLWAVSWES